MKSNLKTNKKDITCCPSGRCKEGSLLLGVVTADRTISYLSNALIVNQEFVQIASKGREPLKRFRFAETCIESNCKQWKEKKCNVIQELVRLNIREDKTCLPECSIRNRCRWFEQEGVAACRICPEVITGSTL